MVIFYWDKAFHTGKKTRKNYFAPSENIPVTPLTWIWISISQFMRAAFKNKKKKKKRHATKLLCKLTLQGEILWRWNWYSPLSRKLVAHCSTFEGWCLQFLEGADQHVTTNQLQLDTLPGQWSLLSSGISGTCFREMRGQTYEEFICKNWQMPSRGWTEYTILRKWRLSIFAK